LLNINLQKTVHQLLISSFMHALIILKKGELRVLPPWTLGSNPTRTHYLISNSLEQIFWHCLDLAL